MHPMDLHNLITIIAIGVASNLDNAGVGVAYGVRKIYISPLSNLIIAVISFLATLVAGYFGNWLSHWISPFVGNITGAVIIIAVGVWVLWQPYIGKKGIPKEEKPKKKNFITNLLRRPEDADFDQSNSIGLMESAVLGVALSINALAGGFDAGVTKLNILETAAWVGLFSFLLLGFADYLGEKYAAEKLKDKASWISGILLILIGFHQML